MTTETTDVQDLAAEFLGQLGDERDLWVRKFQAWAAERQLSPEMTRAVKVEALRIRVFGAMDRGAARRRRA